MPDLFGTPPTDQRPSRHEVLKELEREIGQRKVVYAGFVRRGSMKQGTMDRRIACIEEAIRLIEGESP